MSNPLGLSLTVISTTTLLLKSAARDGKQEVRAGMCKDLGSSALGGRKKQSSRSAPSFPCPIVPIPLSLRHHKCGLFFPLSPQHSFRKESISHFINIPYCVPEEQAPQWSNHTTHRAVPWRDRWAHNPVSFHLSPQSIHFPKTKTWRLSQTHLYYVSHCHPGMRACSEPWDNL